MAETYLWILLEELTAEQVAQVATVELVVLVQEAKAVAELTAE